MTRSIRRTLGCMEDPAACNKAEQIKEAFRDWIFKEPKRRKKYVDFYNETFNCDRQRSYDGSYLKLPGLNSLLKLRPYQKNAVARAFLSCVKDDISNDKLAFVWPLYYARFWKPSFAPFSAPRIRNDANMNLAVMPNVRNIPPI